MVGKLIRGVRIVFAQPDRYLQLSLMMSLKNKLRFRTHQIIAAPGQHVIWLVWLSVFELFPHLLPR